MYVCRYIYMHVYIVFWVHVCVYTHVCVHVYVCIAPERYNIRINFKNGTAAKIRQEKQALNLPSINTSSYYYYFV